MNSNTTIILFGAIAIAFLLVLSVLDAILPKNLPYKKKHLLSKTEYAFWKILQNKANENGILICPKVRMEDFIEITSSKRSRQSWRGRVKSRHIDFIICDCNLRMLAGVELDDDTHKYNKATIESDKFKNEVFKKIEVPLYRIVVGKDDYNKQIDDMLNSMRSAHLIETTTNNR